MKLSLADHIAFLLANNAPTEIIINAVHNYENKDESRAVSDTEEEEEEFLAAELSFLEENFLSLGIK